MTYTDGDTCEEWKKENRYASRELPISMKWEMENMHMGSSV